MNRYRRQWDMASFTNPSQKPYKISECSDGHWECSCPAWTFHTPRRDCKHIDKLKSNMRLIEAANPTWEWVPQAKPGRVAAAAAVPVSVRIEKYNVRPRLLDDVEIESSAPERMARAAL